MLIISFKSAMEIVLYALLFLLAAAGLLLILVKGYDYYLIKKEVLSRKGIGDFASFEEWKSAVRNKVLQWIAHMPAVQVSDNMRFVLLEKMSGKYSYNALQAWQRGGLLLGLSYYLEERPEDKKASDAASYAIKELFDRKNDWKTVPGNIDYGLLAYAVMRLPHYNNRLYYDGMKKVADLITEHTGEDGTVFYRKAIANYRLVDTVGLICPFLIRFGTVYNKPELVDLALQQIENYSAFGLHPSTGIPAHAYHIKNKVPLGIYGWGRGVGWYALGLIDSYEELPQNHPRKEFLGKSIMLLAQSFIRFQRPDGGWGHSFFMDDNQFDSSVTAMLLYFIKKSLKHGIIGGDVYLKAIEKGMQKLKTSTRKDGTIDFSQGDTKGIGTYSTVFREFPFTQGIALAVLMMP